MYFVSSSSSSLEQDAVVEPPGGVEVLRARALLDLTDDLAEDTVERALRERSGGGPDQAALTDAGLVIAEAIGSGACGARPGSRRPSVYECARCGWYPARSLVFGRIATLLFAGALTVREQSLCRACGTRRYHATQLLCLLLGFLGVGLLATPVWMLRNLWHRWRLRRLPPPYFRAAEVVTGRREPASRFLPAVMRMLWWGTVAAAVLAAITADGG